MSLFTLFSIVITFAAAIGYINQHSLRLQPTTAIMSGSLLLSIVILISTKLGYPNYELLLITELGQFNFHDLLMQGMLSFLLFAGAMTINFNYLRQAAWEIGILAIVGTILSTILIAGLTYYTLPWLGIKIPFEYCLLFGAVISPTDPIAVLAIFKQMRASKRLHIVVAGESLFNDGVAIVIFMTLYHWLFTQQTEVTMASISLFFIKQSIGGILYGIILGFIGRYLLATAGEARLAVLITMAIATGGYTLADAIGTSGPLAMVAAGIVIGNQDINKGYDRTTQNILQQFWELIDEVLNAVLFFIIGIELVGIIQDNRYFAYALVAIPITLLVRWLVVAVPLKFTQRWTHYPKYFVSLVFWGGLRGGLAVALALALPQNEYRPLLLAMTYLVVLFSILVQGNTIKYLVKKSHCK